MRVFRALTLVFSLSICSLWALTPAFAQLIVAISVDVAPPPLPVYVQPSIPAPGYLWVPGYWAWDDDVGYYWVPGTWVLPPEPELLWTPGYWGWDDGYYVFHAGYWGPHIGFYGGVVYGFGYDGVGYEGGYWRNGAFFYNRTINNISNVSITNVYSKTVIINNKTNVSFNGGAGGTTVKPTPEQLAIAQEHHVGATADQTRHAHEAAKDPALSLANNHGHPTVAATMRAARFKGPGVIAAQPGQPIAAVSPKGHSKEIREQRGPAGTGITTTTPGTNPSMRERKGPAGTGITTTTPGTNPSMRERKGPAGTGITTTTPGTNPSMREHKGPAGTGITTTTPGTNPSMREHKGPAGTGITTTTPGTNTGQEIRAHKGNAGGTNTGPGSKPPSQKIQSSVTRPPMQPMTRAAPPPPPPPRQPSGKPKCQPGQKCD